MQYAVLEKFFLKEFRMRTKITDLFKIKYPIILPA